MICHLYRRWLDDTVPLSAWLNPCIDYGDGNRATGYLEAEWLTPLFQKLDTDLGVRFTVAAFQAYADGQAATDWHSDTPFDAQAILSVGATRTIGLRHGDSDLFLPLGDGDLLYMSAGWQTEWEHCIFPEPAVRNPRVARVPHPSVRPATLLTATVATQEP